MFHFFTFSNGEVCFFAGFVGLTGAGFSPPLRESFIFLELSILHYLYEWGAVLAPATGLIALSTTGFIVRAKRRNWAVSH